MGKHTVGIGMIVVGVAFAAIGLAGVVLDSGEGPPTAAGSPPATESPDVTESPDETESPPAIETPEQFLSVFTEAVQTGDSDFLLARLHPDVIDFYGKRECRAFVANFEDPTVEFVFRSVKGPGVYEWAVDGNETDVDDVLTVTATIAQEGEKSKREIHLGIVGTKLRWFTDCGEPA